MNIDQYSIRFLCKLNATTGIASFDQKACMVSMQAVWSQQSESHVLWQLYVQLYCSYVLAMYTQVEECWNFMQLPKLYIARFVADLVSSILVEMYTKLIIA